MKTRIVSRTSAVLLICWTAVVASGQPQAQVTTKEFMREKLELSQKLLAALATEDYFTLEKVSQRLSAMTREASWQAFQNPDYTAFSASFRSQVNALSKAAKEKNIDTSTLAYVRMTMSCVDCHKWVRGRVVAALPPSGELRLAGKSHVPLGQGDPQSLLSFRPSP